MSDKAYKVYVHVFPDGKRYVGSTCMPLKTRWSGGMGYENQPVFDAILRFGWNNVRHYILMDNLSKDEASLYEAAFIHSWKTYNKSKGYNTVVPRVEGADDINVPTFQQCRKIRVDDIYDDDINERYMRKLDNPSPRRKKVQCIETGQIFDSAQDAAFGCELYHGGRWACSGAGVQRAIYSGRPYGMMFVYSEPDDAMILSRVHWRYVDKSEQAE